MKIAYLFSLLVAGSTAAEWFPCEPYYSTPVVSDPTTTAFDKHGSKLRSILEDYRQKKWEDIMRESRAIPFDTKCTMLRPPLNHDDPTGPKIDLFVKCYSTSSTSTGVMFFLQGGPGGSAIAMEGLMEPVVRAAGDLYDVCTLDFRGVFRSNALDCDANQAETPGSIGACEITPSEAADCRKGLEISTDLTYFDTTQAAKDLMFAIQAYTPIKTKSAIYGVSYGTYWLGRFAQIYPDGADLLIFDSVVNMAGQYIVGFHQWDYQNDKVLKEYFKRCKSDSFCAEKMTSDPLAFAKKTINNVFGSSSTCPEIKNLFKTKEALSLTFFGLLQRLEYRTFINALIYRLDRCNSGDVTTIINLFSSDPSLPGSCFSDFSNVIYYNVISAELYDETLTRDQVINNGNALDFNGGVALSLFDVRKEWFFETKNQYYNQTLSPSSKTRILVLGSDLDPQTIIDSTQNFYDNLNVTANQAYLGVSVGGVHATIVMASLSQPNCGFDVVNAFVKNPNSKPNMDCLTDTVTDDFEGNFAAYLLGIDSIFESTYSGAFFNSPVMLSLIAFASLAIFFF